MLQSYNKSILYFVQHHKHYFVIWTFIWHSGSFKESVNGAKINLMMKLCLCTMKSMHLCPCNMNLYIRSSCYFCKQCRLQMHDLLKGIKVLAIVLSNLYIYKKQLLLVQIWNASFIAKDMKMVYKWSLILITQKGSALILDTCTMQIINTQTLVTIMPDNAHDQKCTLQDTSYQIRDPCCPIGTRPNSKWVYKKSRAYVMIVLGIMGATRIHNSVSLLPKTYQVSVTTS